MVKLAFVPDSGHVLFSEQISSAVLNWHSLGKLVAGASCIIQQSKFRSISMPPDK